MTNQKRKNRRQTSETQRRKPLRAANGSAAIANAQRDTALLVCAALLEGISPAIKRLIAAERALKKFLRNGTLRQNDPTDPHGGRKPSGSQPK